MVENFIEYWGVRNNPVGLRHIEEVFDEVFATEESIKRVTQLIHFLDNANQIQNFLIVMK
jgi:hypothetical protein